MLPSLAKIGSSAASMKAISSGGLVTKTDAQGCVWLGETNWSGGVPLGYKTADPIFAFVKQSQGYVMALPPLHTTRLIFVVLSDRKTTLCLCEPAIVSQTAPEIQKATGHLIQPYTPKFLDPSPLAQAPLGLLAPLHAYGGVAYAIVYPRREPPEALFPSKLLQ